MERPNWDDYFLKIAEDVATRATCDRKLVGAVITFRSRILSTGYNGAPRGLPHCSGETGVGHELVDGHCVRTAHAEGNAIANAARAGVAIEGGTLYTTASPCYDCMKLIINAGIVRVVAGEFYDSRYGKSGSVEDMFTQAGVEFDVISDA